MPELDGGVDAAIIAVPEFAGRAMRKTLCVALGIACAIAALPGGAAVTSVGGSGFAVRHEAAIAAPPAKVYDALVNVAAWWSSAHTYSKSAANMSIDARAGGCFCERLSDGGSIEHMRVLYAAPGQALRLSGALGPLAAHGLAGSMTWRLAPAADGTTLVLTYSIGGFMEGGFDKMAPAVDHMLGEQFQRLRSVIEAK